MVRRSTGYSAFKPIYSRECLLPIQLAFNSWNIIDWKAVQDRKDLIMVRMKQLDELHVTGLGLHMWITYAVSRVLDSGAINKSPPSLPRSSHSLTFPATTGRKHVCSLGQRTPLHTSNHRSPENLWRSCIQNKAYFDACNRLCPQPLYGGELVLAWKCSG